MTAAAGVLTGLAKLKRQDSARSQHRPIPPTSAGLGNPDPEAAPRFYLSVTDANINANIQARPVNANDHFHQLLWGTSN